MPLKPRWWSILGAIFLVSGSAYADQTGTLRAYLFDGVGEALPGVRARAATSSATSDREGALSLLLPAGEHVLAFELPDGRRFASPAVGIRAGRTSELLVVVPAEGAIEFDLEIPESEAVDRIVTNTERRPVTGRLLEQDGAPIAGARVFVRGLDVDARSDTEGRFLLQLPLGENTLHVIEPGHATASRAVVVGEENAPIEIRLEPKAAQLAELVILVPKPDYGSAAEQLAIRRDASSVRDAIGLEDIKKTPDNTASTATRRIVGATVIGGQFLNVRGLGGRYSSVRLNGVPLPSTDPDLPGFQIDLFPVTLLSSLTVVKTFTPDIPGDFAGGSMNIETRDYPSQFTLTLSLSGSADSQTLGLDVPSYPGSSGDWFGFDSGTRSLPDAVPDVRVASGRNGLPRAQITEIGRSFAPNWRATDRTGHPSFNFGASVGDTVSLFRRRLGYLFTLGYRHTLTRQKELVTNVKLEEQEGELTVALREQLSRITGGFSTQIGLLGTASYELARHHELRLVSLLTQSSDDVTGLTTGFSESEGFDIRQTQFNFVERQMVFNQLLGKHEEVFGKTGELSWQLNFSSVARDQPDTRNMLYINGPQGFGYRNVTGSGERLFSILDQLDFGGGLDAKIVLGDWTLKAGYLGRFAAREFSARRFGTRYTGTPEQRLLPPEQLFSPENYGVAVEILEVTRPDDGYRADQVLNALYGMTEFRALPWLRAIGGGRLEIFNQSIRAASPFSTQAPSVAEGSQNDLDGLLSLGVVAELSKTMSLRLGYGGTVARPLVRELAPFTNQDFVRRRNIQGNPELERTFIHNLDLRWELFPSEKEVISVSGFAKFFESPIESVVIDQGGNLTFENIPKATSFGAEFELRFQLERIARALRGFSAMANLALIQSQVQLAPEQLRAATSRERPLAGQSPYVANVSLGYEPIDTGLSFYVFYNVFGRRILDVGRLGLPDIYEEPFHSLDATAFWRMSEHWTAGLSGRNLLNQATRVDQGGFEFSRVQRGVVVGASLSWTH